MPGRFKTNVTAKDVEYLKDGSVAIKSTGLLNTFVHSAPHALGKMAERLPLVSMDSISVDEQGRIVIDDPAFVAALKKIRAAKGGGDTNYVCKNAYQCKSS